MNYISSNIRHLRTLKGFSQEYLGEELKWTRSRVNSYEDGRTQPSIEGLVTLSDYFKIPIDILVKVDLQLTKETSFIDIGNQRILFPITVDSEDENLIEVVPVNTSAGYLNGYDDPEYIEQLAKMKLPFVPTGKHRAFPIKGDSMLPLRDGSFVVAKFIESFDEINNGSSYIILTRDDGMTYKRVYNQVTSLLVKPDNPNYEAYEISKGEVLELWEFTCSINTQEYDEHDLRYSSIVKMLNELKVELEVFNRPRH